MKLLKMFAAVAVFATFFAYIGVAHAGQGFYITFDSLETDFPTATIGNIDYKDWYEKDISQGASIPGNASTKLYTEHCAAFFGCGSEKGDQSLADDGILWSLMSGTNHIVNFCLSNNYPISSTCGVQGTGGSQLIYDNWIAGCHVPNGGYTCIVTEMGQSGDQIAITYQLGLPSFKK